AVPELLMTHPVTHRISRILVPAAALALAATQAPAQTHHPAGTPITPVLATETFDSAWSVIDRSLWDTTVVSRQWRQARTDLRPRALRARTVEELRDVLEEMVGRLPYSHFEVMAGS